MKIERAQIQRDIKQFVRENFLQAETTENLPDDYPLLGKGVIDSVSMLMLINYIEETYDISFEVHEIAREEFDTFQHITQQVIGKLNEKAPDTAD